MSLRENEEVGLNHMTHTCDKRRAVLNVVMNLRIQWEISWLAKKLEASASQEGLRFRAVKGKLNKLKKWLVH